MRTAYDTCTTTNVTSDDTPTASIPYSYTTSFVPSSSLFTQQYIHLHVEHTAPVTIGTCELNVSLATH